MAMEMEINLEIKWSLNKEIRKNITNREMRLQTCLRMVSGDEEHEED